MFYLNVHGSWSPPSPQGSMAGIVTSNIIPFGLVGGCNASVERSITLSTTNTSDSAACSVSTCNYDVAQGRLSCSVNYDLGVEVVRAVHIHWRSFVHQGASFPPGRIVFNVNYETARGTAYFDGAVPQNMTLAIQS